MGKNIKLWNEFTPYLYEVKAMLTADNKQDSKNKLSVCEKSRKANIISK